MEPQQFSPNPQITQNPLPVNPNPRAGASILSWNIGILVAYLLAFIVLSHMGNIFGSNILFIYLYVYLAHAAILLVFSIMRLVQGKRSEAGMYFLCAIMIPIIAFGACTVAAIGGAFNPGLTGI